MATSDNEDKRPRPPAKARAAARPKAGKTDKAAVMGAGVAQVVTLVRELAVAGVAGVDAERVAQIRALGEDLRENKLRRLSARTIELAALLAHAAQHSFQAGDYADHLCDMLLTARKLEKHLGGEALDNRHVEELVGKTWGEKDRAPISDLHLVEYSFATATTADQFLVRESRFFDVQSGVHYTEKQIVPAFLKRVEPKRSYLGQVLLGARGGVYPGFAPVRLKLEDAGTQAPLTQEVLQALCARALPGVSATLAAFQEQRKDLFAPTHMPAALRVAALLAEGKTLRALDEEGHALALPVARDPGLEARLSTLLRAGRLRVLLGRVDVDDALPTLFPLSAVLEGPLGLELQPLTAPQKEVEGRSRRAAVLGGGKAARWGETAQRLGASPAAVALEEVREELAQALVQGLVALQPRTMDPLAQRLQELGLTKQAQLLRDLMARPEPAARLDDFVKLYQVLEIALVRLCAAARVDREHEALLPVPTYEGVLVRDSGERLEPREVMLQRTRGLLGRYEAALHYARFYEGLRGDELLQRVLPSWADGGAIPFIVRALARRGEEALAAAARALSSKSPMAKATAVELLRALAITPAATAQCQAADKAVALLIQVQRGDFARPRSYGGTSHAYWYWEWGGTLPPLQVRAQDALDAIALGLGSGHPRVSRSAAEGILERRRKQQRQLQQHLLQLNAATAGERVEAIHQLAKLGDLEGAAPALRLCAGSDTEREVRQEATLALGLLGDWEMVEHFTLLLNQRHEEPAEAKAGAYALGYLGDSRGIAELLGVLEEGWEPTVVGEALRAVGEVLLTPLLDLLLRRAELLGRKAVQEVLRQLPAKDLAEHLAEHLIGHLTGHLTGHLPSHRADPLVDAPHIHDELHACLRVAAPNRDAPARLGQLLKERLPALPEEARAPLQAALDALQKKEETKGKRAGINLL